MGFNSAFKGLNMEVKIILVKSSSLVEIYFTENL